MSSAAGHELSRTASPGSTCRVSCAAPVSPSACQPGVPARSHPTARTARGYAAIVTDAAAPGRVLIWDFDGTLGHRPAHWSGAVADALTDVLGPHEFSQDMIAAEIRSGFPWHSPEVPHPHLADGDSWWQQLGEVLAAAMGRLGVAPAAAAAAASRVRSHYIDPASWQLFPGLDDRGQPGGRCRRRRQCWAPRHSGTDPASRRQPSRARPGRGDRPCRRPSILSHSQRLQTTAR